MSKNIKLKNGYTLIELILYISLFAVIIFIISMSFFSFFEARIKNQTISEVEGEGIQIMQLITQTIRNANNVNSPAIGVNDISLSLNVTNPFLSPTIFYLTGDEIKITEGVNPDMSLNNSSRVIISGLLFENLSRASTPDIIGISFTLSHVNLNGKNEYNYSKTFYGSASLRY
ncbi:MAG: type II secretion system protein [Minisyncoccia bacterium]